MPSVNHMQVLGNDSQTPPRNASISAAGYAAYFKAEKKAGGTPLPPDEWKRLADSLPLKKLPAGTILHHGTAKANNFNALLDRPTWFAYTLPKAGEWSTWADRDNPRVLSFELTEDLVVPETTRLRDWAKLGVVAGAGDDPSVYPYSQFAKMVCAVGFPGWASKNEVMIYTPVKLKLLSSTAVAKRAANRAVLRRLLAFGGYLPPHVEPVRPILPSRLDQRALPSRPEQRALPTRNEPRGLLPPHIPEETGQVVPETEALRAIQHPDHLTPAEHEQFNEATQLIPNSIRQRLRKAFTVRGLGFFDFYVNLRKFHALNQVPNNLRDEFKRVSGFLVQAHSPVDHRPLSPLVVNQIAEARTILSTWFNRLEHHPDDTNAWRHINATLVPLISLVARDKHIYIKPLLRGTERWGVFRQMTERQEYVEKLRDDDPESYALLMEKGKAIQEIEDAIQNRIIDGGLVPEKKFLMGRPVYLGVNPHTNEAQVFDRDGDVVPVAEYIEKRKKQEEAKRDLQKVPNKTSTPFEDLRRLSDATVASLDGPLQYMSPTDDKAKQGRLTRVFPVKDHTVLVSHPGGQAERRSYKVIVEGRYKGTFLDDLVNSQGRMIEGTCYAYNPKSGRTFSVPQKIDPGQREPYITVTEVGVERPGQKKLMVKQLFLKIPGSKEYTHLRQAVKTLASNIGNVTGTVPSIIYQPVEGSRAANFYFEAKDFGLLRDTLKGLSMSLEASKIIKSYYEDLTRADQATAAANLSNYRAEALGGFIGHRKDPATGEMVPFDLSTDQKKSLAWADANGNKGVVALETGKGKTLCTIALMQKFERDGLGDAEASYTDALGKEVLTNGRYLFVCPGSLRGNLPKEMHMWLKEPGVLRDKVDVISYTEFALSSRNGQVPKSISKVPYWRSRKVWDAKFYIAVFADEAQELKNLTSAGSRAMQTLWHPRKILLSASPMEKNPMEAAVLAFIANNKPMRGPEGEKNREELRRIKERYCVVVGGRIVGIKQDPLIKRELMTWVKRNIFYADKESDAGDRLPPLRAQTTTVEMQPGVEQVYRAVTDRFAKTMEGMVVKFRDLGVVKDPVEGKERIDPRASDPDLERVFSRHYRPILKILNDLSNYPEIALNEIADMIGKREMPNGKPLPDNLKPFLTNVQKAVGGVDALRALAASVGDNPKLKAAGETIQSKLARLDGNARTLLFADDNRLCLMAGPYLAKHIPGRHVVALAKEIRIFEGDKELSEIRIPITPDVWEKLIPDEAQRRKFQAKFGNEAVHKLPFKQGLYRKCPGLPVNDKWNQAYKPNEWQTFVLKEIVSPDPHVKTATLHGQTYQVGQNLQAFNTVIHLDRDTWNAQDMKQRRDRSWRRGQSEPVDEFTIDCTYAESKDGAPRGDLDRTLDEIRHYFQQMEGGLFDRTIRDAQAAELGKEWLEMKHRDASNLGIDKALMETMLSPYYTRSKPPESPKE